MPEQTPVTPDAAIARVESLVGDEAKRRAEDAKKIQDKLAEHDVRFERLEKRTPLVNERRDLRLLPVVRGLITGNFEGVDGYEKRTDMSVTTAANGGYITPPVYSNQMVDILRAKAVLKALGVSVVVAPRSKSITFSRKLTGTSAAYLGENSAVQVTSPTFGPVSVTPHLAGCYTAMSRLLADNSDPSAEQIVRDDFSKSAAILQDDTGLFGDGTGSNPTGLFNNNDVTVNSPQATITLDHCLDAISAVENRDGMTDPSKAAFLMHPALWGKLRKTKGSTNDHYILSNDMASPTRKSIQGFPVFTSTRMEITTGGTDSSYAMAFGVWSELRQTVWDDITIESSKEAGDAFLKHQILLKMIWADDWTVIQPEAFECYQDLYAS